MIKYSKLYFQLGLSYLIKANMHTSDETLWPGKVNDTQIN